MLFRSLRYSLCVTVGSVFLIAGLLPNIAHAGEISLESITQQAINEAYDLKIAQLDIRINRTDIKAARSEYYPTLKATLNTEYLKGLGNQYSPVISVGNSVLPSGTRFQNSIGVNLNHNLIDFGSRKRKVIMAQKATAAKTSTYFQTLRDLRIKLIDLYTEALISYKAWKANDALLQLSQQAYQLKKRLYTAGTTSNVTVAEEAIQVAQALDNSQHYKEQYQQQLENLSYYTHEVYDPAETDLADLKDEPGTELTAFLVERTPESRIYDALIAQKQSEIEYLKRQYLPQVSMYSYYNLYGFDPEKLSKSISNIGQRTISFGLSVNLPVFDGFKNQAAIEKAKLEKEKLRVQKEEKLAQLAHQAKQYQQQIDGYSVQLQTKATILNKTQDKLTMVKRLSDEQLVDQTQAIKEHMERIKKQVDVEKSLIQGLAALKKLKILAEG